MFRFNKTFAFAIFFVPSIVFSAQIHQVNNKDAIMIRHQVATENSLALAKNQKVQRNNLTSRVLALAKSTDNYQLKVISNGRSSIKHQRYQQYFNNIPIWGKQVVIKTDKDSNMAKLNGAIVSGINSDLPTKIAMQANFDDQHALQMVKQQYIDKNGLNGAEVKYSQEHVRQYIYLDENNTAILAYYVNYFLQTLTGKVAKPSVIINAKTEEILKQWDSLNYMQATGTGGNQKVGRYEYGTDFDALVVRAVNGTCTLQNDNLKTVDLNHGISGTTAHAFICPRNTYKEFNGAYSPLNDAHFFGTTVVNMFNDWYNIAPLYFPLIMGVHYSLGYENAFWDGFSAVFGDGGSRLFPLVSLDVAGHEIAHGITQQYSGLIYNGQSGGINEAFSDIMGEAAEFYFRGINDWLVGADIVKADGALRYFEQPSNDGFSINYAKDYSIGMDVHYSSGVFNRAFYILATSKGWDTHKAFDAIFDANRHYWTTSTNYVDGACGVINAADDLGYNVYDTINAFQEVGITCRNLPFLDNDNDGMSDYWEYSYGLDFNNPNDASMDEDFDGLTNQQEFTLGTDPQSEDTDNDGLADGWEVAFNYNPLTDSGEATLDEDSDGLTNLQEFTLGTDPQLADTDQDGVIDSEDNHPTDSSMGSNQVPIFEPLDDMTIEAKSTETRVELIIPRVSDNNVNLPVVSASNLGPYRLGVHQIRWTAIDFAGNESSAVQTLTVEDTAAPIFDPPIAISINAQGRLTNIVSLINVVAYDLVDGEINALPIISSQFKSGHHQVELRASDLSGNTSDTMIDLTIIPQISLEPSVNVSAGGQYHIQMNLSGNAVDYPVTVKHQVLNSYGVIAEGSSTINNDTQGGITVEISDKVIPSDNLTVKITEVSNARLSKMQQTALTIINHNVRPLLQLFIGQNNQLVNAIDPDKGLATLSAVITDVNYLDTHDIKWTVANNAFIDVADDDSNLTFEFDPALLNQGAYEVNVDIKENNTAELLEAGHSMLVIIEDLAELSTELDTDNDGIIDNIEGYQDSNDDGIADYLDNETSSHVLVSAHNSQPMQTLLGYRLSLGDNLKVAQGANSINASLTRAELVDSLDTDAASTLDDYFIRLTPLYNFTIDGFDERGGSIALVIPLPEGMFLPANAIYRQYNSTQGWFTFVENSKNTISSALVNEHGNCPIINSSLYRGGLKAQDNCIRLIIEDGGANDSDFIINGAITDLSVIAVEYITINSHDSLFTEGSRVTLSVQVNASENDTLVYLWTQLSGPTVLVSDASAKQISFTAPNVESNQTIEFKVTVTDGVLSASTSTHLTITEVLLPKEVPASFGRDGGGSTSWIIFIIFINGLVKTINLKLVA